LFASDDLMTTNNNSFVSNKLTLAKRIGKKIVYQVNKVEKNPAESTVEIAESKKSIENSRRLMAEFRQQQVQTMLAWLEKEYPNCFNSNAKKPLKIGIHKELRQLHPEVSHRGLERTLYAYIHAHDYYTAVLKEKNRYDLEGKPCGVIRKADKIQAQVLLDK
jgi:hypothetical protein